MTDTRDSRYAELLVDTCLGVQPGWQVLVLSSVHGRPLVEELAGLIGRRGAYAIVHVGFGGGIGNQRWAQEAPLELLRQLPEIDRHALLTCDAIVQVQAPENTRELTGVAPERLQALNVAIAPVLERLAGENLPWVGCQYPTPALAQEAGMSTEDFAEFLFGACLLDWEAERERMQRYADRFDAAGTVRIVGAETDLTLSIEGRTMEVDAAGRNIPGGEFFTSPVETTAAGEIAFTEFPAVYAGRELQGIRLRFDGGRVVEASADTNEEFLLHVLDQDGGARFLGELGIGCNPGITRYMRNTLFDEKIDGTVHLALGKGIASVGGTNESAIHWDLVKDLRKGGRIELDGDIVQQDGRWTI
jgi:aminopeptidase